MDLHRTGLRTRTDCSSEPKSVLGPGGHGRESKGVVGPLGGVEERLDSGLDSLQEEEYQAVAAELSRLRVEGAPVAAPEDWSTAVTDDGDSLLHLAIIHEAKDYVRNLIHLTAHSPFLNTHNDQRQTPLHLAVITDQPDVCEQLLLAGGDVELVDDSGDTPLHIACRRGNLTCFSVITQNCQSEQLKTVMAACNYQGQNCLHLAAVQGFLHMVETLVALGADINAQEQCNGRSALHLAVDQQNLPLVRLLLKSGSDPNHLTYGGHSPFHLTYGRHDDNIRKELLPLTNPELRELPDSESEDSEEEEEEQEEVDACDDEEVSYDDIQWNGH